MRGSVPFLCTLLLLNACGDAGSADTSVDTPLRIAVMAPAAAEMLEALGVADRIVAVGDYVRTSAAIADRPRLGAYDAPNLERLVGLGADLYISSKSEAARGVHARIESLGIRVLALDLDTLDGILTSTVELGRVVGRAEQAGGLAASIQRELDAVAASTRGLESRKVLFVVGREPLYVAGPNSLLGELVRIAGGNVVAGGGAAPYQLFSMEAALGAEPAVIVDTSDNRPGAEHGRSPGPWARWDFLPAVAADRVFRVHPDRLVIPGTHVAEAAALLARMIHPEALGAPDLSAYEEPPRAR